MKLYNSNLSPFTARVRIVALAKGLDFECVKPGADYKTITPIGKVPVLIDDQVTLPESDTICEYLEDAYPEPSVHGADPAERARVRLIARLNEAYIVPQLLPLFGQTTPKTRDAAVVGAHVPELRKGLGYVDGYLDGSPYAVGGRLTIADANLMPVLFFHNTVMAALGEDPFAGAANTGAYYSGILKDPVIERVHGELAEALDLYVRTGQA